MAKLGLFLCFLLLPTKVIPLEALNSITDSVEFGTSLQLVFFITFLGLIPTLLLVSTSFTRIIITLYFLKTAMGTQQMPPNQVVIGLALFLTFFVMSPVISTINADAIVPYTDGQITQMEFFERAAEPIKEFMVMQTRDEDIKLFMDLSNRPAIVDETDILGQLPYHIVVPAFIISEIRAGFVIGFLMYLPFIIIDMVVASVLMAMGMMMLPPAMISLPFKILIFIVVDGWHLIIGELVETFNL